MRTYKPSELASIAGIHSNTVRFYEKLGFLAKAERQKNNYRTYNDKHVYQLKICRLVFNSGFTNRKIRRASLKIIEAAVKWDIPMCEGLANKYLAMITDEISKALKTIDILKNWMDDSTPANAVEVYSTPAELGQAGNTTDSSIASHKLYDFGKTDSVPDYVGNEYPSLTKHGKTYIKEEAALIIGTTKESIRNWERNGLINPGNSGLYQRRCYSEADVNRMRIIYMLLQTGYSLSVIHRCLHLYDRGYKVKALDTLVDPVEIDIVSGGDRWLASLKKAESKAKEILALICEMKTLDIEL